MEIHDCPKFLELNPEPHERGSTYGYGIALDNGVSRDENGRHTMGNSEYGVIVAFCPFCGVELAKLPTEPT